jgi:hypothetical protein
VQHEPTVGCGYYPLHWFPINLSKSRAQGFMARNDPVQRKL